MTVNRVFDEPAGVPEPAPDSHEAIQAKIARLLAQLPKSARQKFYVALGHSLDLTGKAIIELAPAGPRVIDPHRIVFVARPDAPETPNFPSPPEESK